MTNNHIAAAIRDFLNNNDTASIKTALASLHPADIANAIGTLSPDEVARVLVALGVETAAEVFGYLPADMQAETALAMERDALAALITAMSPDERADLFNALPKELQDRLLPVLARADREDIRKLSAYPEGSAGAIMTSDYATLKPDLTTVEAIAKLRREAPNKETIYDSYVVDEDRRLIGVVSLRDLLTEPDEALVGDIMVREVIVVRAGDSQEEAARKIAQYDLLAIPVINGGDALVGIITADDAMDVQAAEATEDFYRAGGVQDVGSDQKGYLPGMKRITNVRTASTFVLYRMRIVWLVLLVFGNIFSGEGIAYFEDTIMAYVALVFFLPLLIDSGGNAGSQAATLMVRGLAVGDVKLSDWGRMIGRESFVALLLGITMAAAVSIIGIFRGGPEIALVVSLSMVVIVLVGSIIGMSLPFILSRFKLDPAAASAPLITSIADAAGVVIYFSIATALLDINAAAA
ncbi:MAG: magnesium transporter [Oceanicaulis sp.]|uniref:magnesium transporter n=1 Tax=Glycocaulis sp. TaxID=1969725 RepID=UPI0025C5466E|nr:magnesium transporter [Glycocaulis sp.]MCC5980644.1 magnesium transporter [Oceanicaulis sp.]MCH8520609.1 magnesium transporter [Glycocaulis sp.]